MDAIFFPRNDYPNNVEICAHRLGKKMTYTESTDSLSLSSSYTPFMTLAKARGIKVSSFVELPEFSESAFETALQDYLNGCIWFDLYSRCPSLEEKIHTHQTITEQEYDYAYQNELLPGFYNAVGKKPVCLSYSYGNDTFKNYIIPDFLGARNSIPVSDFSNYDFPTDYGVGNGNPSNQAYFVERYKSKANSYRWYDAAKADNNHFQGQLAIVSQKIDETMLNGGWFNNFTHWHQYWQDGNEEWAEEYLDLLETKNANNEIYFSGYGEAVAYLVYRQLITRAVMYSPIGSENERLIIQLEATNTPGLNTELLQTPISIKFSTIGTPLQGQSINSNCNLVDLGSGEYIVEIPYSRFPRAIIQINP